MFRDFLIVGMGSFLGGGLRLVVSRIVDAHAASAAMRLPVPAAYALPMGTLAVNVLGCLAIGFISGLPAEGVQLPHHVRVFLTTGFCGGFTTFSTFINESSAMAGECNFTGIAAYVAASLALGFAALALGNWAAHTI